MSQRAGELSQRLQQFGDELSQMVQQLPEENWTKVLPMQI